MKNKLFGALAFLTVTLFYFRNALWAGHVALVPGGDEETTFFSSQIFFNEWIRRGVFPLWQTLSQFGRPAGLSSVSTFDFFHLANIFFNPVFSYNLVKIAGFFLNGWLLCLFLQRKGLSSFAAWLGGFAWMIVSYEGNPETGFFLLPLLLICFDRLIERATRLNFLLLVFTLFFYDLNANPQCFLYGSLFLFFYAWSQTPPGGGLLKAGRLVLPFGIAFGLALFYFARVWELALLSNRSSWNEAQVFLPTHYPLLLFPKLFSVAGRPDLDFIVPSAFQKWIPSRWQISGFIVPRYVGLLGACAFIFFWGRWKERPNRTLRFFLFFGLGVVAYLTFQPLIYHGVVRHLPFLNGLTNVVRAFDLFYLCLAVSGAFLADFFTQKKQDLNIFSKGFRRGFFVIFSLLTAFFLLHFSLTVLKAPITRELFLRFRIENDPSIFIKDTAAFKAERLAQLFYFLDQATSWTNPHLWLPVGFLAVLAATVWFYKKNLLGSASFKFLLAFFVLMDLGSVYGTAAPSAPASEPFRYSRLADFIKKNSGVYRVLVLEGPTQSFSRMFLRPETSLTYGLATPDGYDQLYLKRYVDFYSFLTKRTGRVGFVVHPWHEFDEGLAAFANCRYVLTARDNVLLEAKPPYEKIYEDGEYKIYRNREALERAFLVQKVYRAKDPADAAHFVKSYPERLRSEVVLETGSAGDLEPPSPAAGRAPDAVEIKAYEPNRVLLSVRAPSESYLVFTDAYYPGWGATVDGKRVPIERADYLFRAIFVNGGSHEVEFRYRPQSLQFGAILSLSSLFLLFILLRFVI
jgi:hypothetical protein